MILSARDLKVRGVLCALRFVHVAWRTRQMRYAYWAWVAVVSDAYRCLRQCIPRVSIDKTYFKYLPRYDR